MYHCIISARDIHCNCFSYYTIYTYISESKNESSDDTSTGLLHPFVKAMGYLILNLRDALNGYVLEKRQMIVSTSYTRDGALHRYHTLRLLKFSNDSYVGSTDNSRRNNTGRTIEITRNDHH